MRKKTFENINRFIESEQNRIAKFENQYFKNFRVLHNREKMIQFSFEYQKLQKIKTIDRNVKIYLLKKFRQFNDYKNKSKNDQTKTEREKIKNLKQKRFDQNIFNMYFDEYFLRIFFTTQ